VGGWVGGLRRWGCEVGRCGCQNDGLDELVTMKVEKREGGREGGREEVSKGGKEGGRERGRGLPRWRRPCLVPSLSRPLR